MDSFVLQTYDGLFSSSSSLNRIRIMTITYETRAYTISVYAYVIFVNSIVIKLRNLIPVQTTWAS